MLLDTRSLPQRLSFAPSVAQSVRLPDPSIAKHLTPSKTPLDMSSRRTGKHRIYMNVGYDLTEEQLRQFFSQFGDAVTDVYLPRHKSGRNKGFGFTTFSSEDALEAALQCEEYTVGGELVKINRAGPRPEHELHRDSDELESSSSGAGAKRLEALSRQPQLFGKGPRLYVGGVPESLTEERLKAHFSRWGNVVDLYFPGKKGQSRVNYCFVTFDNWRAAQRACNQSERNIDGLPLQSINLAQERSAAEMEAPQLVASSGTAQPTADAQPPAAPPAAAAPAFSASNFVPGQPVPSYAQLQQLHLQLLQAQQQLHAQQLTAGLSAQPQPAHPNLLGSDSATLPGMLPAYSASYQQLLASLAGSQGLASSGPANTLLTNPALLGGSSYSMPGAPPLQFPANMPWPPADLSQMWAAQQQQAALQQAAAQQASVRAPAAAGMPMGTMPDGMSGFTSQQPPTPGPFLGGLVNGAPPAPWGWGNAQVGDTFAGGLETAVDLASMAHNPFVNAQAQPRLGSASVTTPMTANPYQVLSLDGFGPHRNMLSRARKHAGPY